MRKGTLNCGRKIWNLTCFTGRSAAACWSEEEMASSSTWTFSSSDFLDEGSALPVLDLLSEDSSGTWATSNGVEPCFWTFSATDLSSPFVANGTQVWSLTQPYSVGVLQSRTSSKERGFFLQIHNQGFHHVFLMVPLFLCSSRSNKGVLFGNLVRSKSPSRVQDWYKGAAGGDERKQYLPWWGEGSSIYPPDESMFLYKNARRNHWVGD